jgi:hypothetical protein
MAECSKCGSPVCKCGPLHYSPLNQFGSLASMASTGRLSAKSMLDSLNKNNSETSTTSGALSNAAAGIMNTGQTPSATSTTSGALAGATPDAGMLSNPSSQNDNSSDIEGRIAALEQSVPSNTLGNAKPVFNAQSQQAAQGIYGQQQVPGTFDRSLDPTAAAPLMKKRKY